MAQQATETVATKQTTAVRPNRNLDVVPACMLLQSVRMYLGKLGMYVCMYVPTICSP